VLKFRLVRSLGFTAFTAAAGAITIWWSCSWGRLACRLAIWLLLSRAREEMEAYERKHGKEQT
jgi:hypothetical protein